MSMFSTPSAPGDGISYDGHKGALLLVEVLGIEDGIKTSFGEKTAVRANVDVLDGPGSGDSYPDTLIFPTLLVSQTKGQIGSKILGRLSQGNAKPGQKPPWLLEEASAADVALAEEWVRKNQPATQAPAAPF